MGTSHRPRVTRRRRFLVSAVAVVVVVGAVMGYFALAPQHAPAVIRRAMDRIGLSADPPPTCPLTGDPAPGGEVPHRPALAIKVENLPEARPQTGLDRADVVYEEPVEGGITRFIAIYQCHEANRVGPVRSGRTTDASVLVQYGRPAMGYAGAAPSVERILERARIIDVNYDVAIDAYTRDPGRPAPHNLYTTTGALWKAAKTKEGAPAPVFTYDAEPQGRSRKVSSVHLPFSSYSDVYWRWNRKAAAWLRFHGSQPHMLTDGRQVSATNVVVLEVQVTTGTIVDAAGNPSPEVKLTGSGRAYVLRDHRAFVGRWERRTLADPTRLVAKDGGEIPLAPGTTWVELLPSTVPVDLG